MNCAPKPVPKTEIKDVPDDGGAETDRTLVTMTCAAIRPVLTPDEELLSTLVATVIPIGFEDTAAPMVRPVTVTVTAVLAAIA